MQIALQSDKETIERLILKIQQNNHDNEILIKLLSYLPIQNNESNLIINASSLKQEDRNLLVDKLHKSGLFATLEHLQDERARIKLNDKGEMFFDKTVEMEDEISERFAVTDENGIQLMREDGKPKWERKFVVKMTRVLEDYINHFFTMINNEKISRSEIKIKSKKELLELVDTKVAVQYNLKQSVGKREIIFEVPESLGSRENFEQQVQKHSDNPCFKACKNDRKVIATDEQYPGSFEELARILLTHEREKLVKQNPNAPYYAEMKFKEQFPEYEQICFSHDLRWACKNLFNAKEERMEDQRQNEFLKNIENHFNVKIVDGNIQLSLKKDFLIHDENKMWLKKALSIQGLDCDYQNHIISISSQDISNTPSPLYENLKIIAKAQSVQSNHFLIDNAKQKVEQSWEDHRKSATANNINKVVGGRLY